jgi:hypothetical protein
MPGLLTTASVMMCPHGGTVQPITTDTRVRAAGSPVLLASDTFVIVGCLLTLPSGPHPCVSVNWAVPAAESQAVGDATLTEASVGFCSAADQAVQGVVLVVATQPRVSGV